jgi:hypothetical protein
MHAICNRRSLERIDMLPFVMEESDDGMNEHQASFYYIFMIFSDRYRLTTAYPYKPILTRYWATNY